MKWKKDLRQIKTIAINPRNCARSAQIVELNKISSDCTIAVRVCMENFY